MKKLALGVAAFTALSGLTFAAFSPTDQVKVFVTGSAGITHDDNLNFLDKVFQKDDSMRRGVR